MKCTGAFGMLYLVALSACGQIAHKEQPVSVADSAKVRSYEVKSGFYEDKAPDSAIYFADKGLKLARRIHYRFGEALMLDRFARINAKYGNLQLAIKLQKEALTIFGSLHHTLAAEASASLGLLEGRKGDFKQAKQLIVTALKAYEKRKDTAGIIKTYTRLGEISELDGNSVEALTAYSKAEQFNKNKPVTDEYFMLLSNMGKLHSQLGNHVLTGRYYEKGIGLSSAQKNSKAHISFLNDAGKTANKQGDKQKALAYHRLGLQKAQAAGLHEEEARSLMGIAGVLRDQDAVQSIRHLRNALDIARSIGQKQLTAEIYRSLSDAYRQQSQYQEALTALEHHHRLLDSLMGINEGHKLAVLQSSYELTESKLRVESLELSNQKSREQRNMGIFAAIAILVILVILAVYFYKTKRLNQRLEASNMIKDKLFSIIGHDLRNPIGGITQMLAIMEEDDLSDEENHLMISEMRRQGNITLEILNALLNWGEAQLKGIHVKQVKFNAKESIGKNIAALQKQAADKSITVIDAIDAKLIVKGDLNHFEFIIRNLLSNAIKFSHPSGSIEIAAEDKAGSDYFVFSVTDHGKGISKLQQELFVKANLDISFGTKGEKGTGIGLMLSKEFVHANHGELWVESEEGKGATFYFSFSRR